VLCEKVVAGEGSLDIRVLALIEIQRVDEELIEDA